MRTFRTKGGSARGYQDVLEGRILEAVPSTSGGYIKEHKGLPLPRETLYPVGIVVQKKGKKRPLIEADVCIEVGIGESKTFYDCKKKKWIDASIYGTAFHYFNMANPSQETPVEEQDFEFLGLSALAKKGKNIFYEPLYAEVEDIKFAKENDLEETVKRLTFARLPIPLTQLRLLSIDADKYQNKHAPGCVKVNYGLFKGFEGVFSDHPDSNDWMNVFAIGESLTAAFKII